LCIDTIAHLWYKPMCICYGGLNNCYCYDILYSYFLLINYYYEFELYLLDVVIDAE
jgi:hypothetical protein